MKVLLDPIYSSRPSHCSSAVKCWKLVDYVLNEKKREDIFFYWMYPKWTPSEDLSWFVDHPNVLLVPFDYAKDRLKEYQNFPEEFNDIVSFGGKYWDFDIYVTNRTSIVPLVRSAMMSPRAKNFSWEKQVFVFEEMPLFDFKKTVSLSHVESQELLCLSGYVVADRVSITVQHELDGIIQEAKRLLSPAKVKDLMNKIVVTNPVVKLECREKEVQYRFSKQRPFNLGFVGRISFSDRTDEVFDLMIKQWVWRGDQNLNLIVSSVSTGGKALFKKPDRIEVQNLPRNEFWEMLKTKVDCVLCFSKEAGLGMSLMEPLMFGTPAIIIREVWSESLLGKEYPFFVDNPSEAFSLVSVLYERYEELYRKFLEWQTSYLKAMFDKGGRYELSLYEYFYKGMCDFESTIKGKYLENRSTLGDNEIISLIKKCGNDIKVVEAIKFLENKGMLRGLGKQLDWDEVKDKVGLVWSPQLNMYRNILKYFFDYKDASVETGHLVRQV